MNLFLHQKMKIISIKTFIKYKTNFVIIDVKTVFKILEIVKIAISQDFMKKTSKVKNFLKNVFVIS